MTILDLSFFLIIAISCVFVKVRATDESTIFDRNTTATLRGLAMIGIIIHHIHNNVGLNSPFLGQVGYLATALFFFISGYGNQFSVNKLSREDNKSHFMWFVNKFTKIYLPFIVVYIISYIYIYIYIYIYKGM